jgi:hypothetical protein
MGEAAPMGPPACELSGEPIFIDGRVPCHACGRPIKAVLIDGVWSYQPHHKEPS